MREEASRGKRESVHCVCMEKGISLFHILWESNGERWLAGLISLLKAKFLPQTWFSKNMSYQVDVRPQTMSKKKKRHSPFPLVFSNHVSVPEPLRFMSHPLILERLWSHEGPSTRGADIMFNVVPPGLYCASAAAPRHWRGSLWCWWWWGGCGALTQKQWLRKWNCPLWSPCCREGSRLFPAAPEHDRVKQQIQSLLLNQLKHTACGG